MSFYLYFALKPFKKRIVMKTEEKTSMDAVAQVIFRPSAECRGSYRFHYGHLAPDGTFVEDLELSFRDFLDSVGVPVTFVAAFVESLNDTEKELCNFGYLSQGRFDEFVRYFSDSCTTVQLYPGMLVLTFNKKENEGW